MEDIGPSSVDIIRDVLGTMCGRIGEKLKNKSLRFKTVTVKMRYSDYTTIQRSKSIPVETDRTDVLQRLAIEIFDHQRDREKALRLVGIKVSGLNPASEQLCLTEFL
nr:MAG: hypothetical protein AM325_16075 [Candidatus Thorarchaeota archaeon SMTZ1-45]